MATKHEENLMAWLRDAHAMEKQAIESIEKQLSRMQNYPELQGWVRDHVEASKRQRDRIRQCIERRGGSVSPLKDIAMTVMGNVQAITGMLAEDEVLKSAIADYAFKHYEIACYTSLAAAASEAGDPETKTVCEEILNEERSLADRLLPYLPQATATYMSKELAGVTAKR